MEIDVLLLHDATELALLDSIAAALDEKGVVFHAGELDDVDAGVRVVVAVGALEPAAMARLLANGVVVVPAVSGGWLADHARESRARRIADAVDALLLIGAPSRRVSEESVQRALEMVRLHHRRELEISPLERICETLRVAIEWGEPICETGGLSGCVRIYRGTAELVSAYISDQHERGEGQLLDAVADELDSALAAVERLREDAVDEQVWTLRHTFDRILVAQRTARALYAIDDLFTGLMQAGRRLNASLIYDIISLSISHGAPVYNDGSPIGCAQIYLCTAAGLLRQLTAEANGDEGRTEPLVRRTLTPLFASGARRLQEDPDALAWSLRRAFDEIVEVAAEERRWEHDS